MAEEIGRRATVLGLAITVANGLFGIGAAEAQTQTPRRGQQPAQAPASAQPAPFDASRYSALPTDPQASTLALAATERWAEAAAARHRQRPVNSRLRALGDARTIPQETLLAEIRGIVAENNCNLRRASGEISNILDSHPELRARVENGSVRLFLTPSNNSTFADRLIFIDAQGGVARLDTNGQLVRAQTGTFMEHLNRNGFNIDNQSAGVQLTTLHQAAPSCSSPALPRPAM